MKRNLGRPSLASRAATVLLAAAALLLGFASPRAQPKGRTSRAPNAGADEPQPEPAAGRPGRDPRARPQGRLRGRPGPARTRRPAGERADNGDPARGAGDGTVAAAGRNRDAIRDRIPSVEQKTERELNRPHYKTTKGELMNFVLDYKYREPGDPPTPGYDQVTVIDPKNCRNRIPNFRSYANGLGEPNGPATVGSIFGTNSLQPSVLAHESLHLIGLDDRYTDIYVYKGREIPLPEGLDSPGQLAQYLKGLKPPLPPPPGRRPLRQRHARDRPLRHHGHRRPAHLPQNLQARPEVDRIAGRDDRPGQTGRNAARQERARPELRGRLPDYGLCAARGQDGRPRRLGLLHRPREIHPRRPRLRRRSGRLQPARIRRRRKAGGPERPAPALARGSAPRHAGGDLEPDRRRATRRIRRSQRTRGRGGAGAAGEGRRGGELAAGRPRASRSPNTASPATGAVSAGGAGACRPSRPRRSRHLRRSAPTPPCWCRTASPPGPNVRSTLARSGWAAKSRRWR